MNGARGIAFLLALLLPLSAVAGRQFSAASPRELPTIVSTNLCADIMALSLAAPEQLLSVSHKSRDPRLSTMVERARRFPANGGSAEEVIALRPDIVLASRRWQSRYPRELFERHGIRVVVVPFPTDWQQIFDSTETLAALLGREQAGAALVDDLRVRLARLAAVERPLSALYLRPNGGSAGSDTYVDNVFAAVGVRNHAALEGMRGWGSYSMEQLVASPPDLFVEGELLRDTAYARSVFSRHPRVRQLLDARPVVRMRGNYWGCSNWQLIEAAEDIARQIDERRSALAGPMAASMVMGATP